MNRPLTLLFFSTSALTTSMAFAQTDVLPTRGTIAAGAATISAQSSALQITQSSDRAIINWESFSIGENNRVDIVQPSTNAALLNRVTGRQTSEIAGQLNANGRVFLVNPNGIMITKTGTVNAASFTASTIDFADDIFMAGRDDLTVIARAPGAPIQMARGGYAGLLAGRQPDHLLIRARLAKVGTIDTSMRALDLTGDGFLQVAVPNANVTVAGTISANEVVLRAGTAREAARQTVNLSGTIAATGVDTVGGVVVLTGGDVNLVGAAIDVSGKTGGGTVKIGGGRQGGGTVDHADALAVDAATTIRADAWETGNGGSVTLWSDGATRYEGVITARGGREGGNGGSVETSGEHLLFNGAIDVSAPRGRIGEILLDPRDLTITATANGTTNAPPTNGTNPNLGYSNPSSATDSYITPTQISALTGNIRLQASRDLTVASAVNYAGGSISLEAGRNVTIAAALTATSGIALTAAAVTSPSYDPTGTLTVNNTLTSAGTIALFSGSGGILLAGTVTGGTGTLALSTTGTINQTAGTITTGTLSGSSAGGAALTKANAITTLGAFTDAANGSLSLTNSRALTIAGTVSIGAGALTLANTGAITQSGGTITAGTLTGSSSGAVAINQANAIATLGPFATSANSSFSLTDAVSTLSLAGNVSVGTGTLTLNNTGTIAQTSGTITAGTLAGSSAGGASFGSTNTVTNLGAFTDTANGSLSLTNGRALALTGVINLSTGTLGLTNIGTITQSGGTITAGSLTGSSVGAAAFTRTNAIGALGAFTAASNGSLSLTDSLPTLSLTGAVNLGTGTLTLTNTGGAITQTGGTITAATLTGSSAGNASFGQANAITNLAAYSTTNNSSLSLTSGVATLNLTGTVGVGTGTFTLNNAGAINQSGGTITSGTLTGSSAGTATLTKANVITSLGAFTTNNSNLSLTNARALTLSGNVSVGNGTLTFANTGAITQSSGTIIAGMLAGTSSGAVTLNQANAVTNLGPFTTSANSSFSLTDAVSTLSLIGNVSVGTGTLSLTNAGTIAQTGGVITSGTLTGASIGGAAFTRANALTNIGAFSDSGQGNLSLTDSSTLVLTGDIMLGSGSLILGVGSITQSGGTITAGTLTGTSTSSVTLGRANAIATLGPFATSANSSFSLTDAVSTLSLAGNVSVGTGTLTLNNTGTIAQTSGTITAGTLAGSSAGGASFGSTNTVTNLGAFTDTANGSLSLTNGRALALTGVINLSTGTLGLTNIGTITQSGGTITAGSLTGSSVGAAAFTRTNAIGALGAFTAASNGSLSLTDSLPTLSLTGAVNLGTGTLTLTNTGGAITQTGGTITAATLTGSSAGNASFGQANAITNLAAYSTTNNSSLSLTSGVATLNLTGTVGVGTGTFTLNNAGAINQSGGTITSGTLTGSSAGTATLTKANVITSLGAFTTNNSNLSLTNARALTLSGNVSVGNGTLTFANTGAITQSSGTIIAGMLAGTSSGAVTLNQANAVTNLGPFTTSANSSFSLTDAVSTLSLIGNVSVGTGTLSLTNAGTIAQTGGVITSGTLTGASIGGAAFTRANGITTLGSFDAGDGDFALVTAGATMIGGAVATGTGDALVRSGGTLTIASSGGVSGQTITLVSPTQFINNAGSSALTANDRWLVYSQNPANDTAGGLAFDFRQYAAQFGTTAVAQSGGNGFLHSLAPTISVSLQSVVAKTYDGSADATLDLSNFAQSGALNGDDVVLALPTQGTFATANVGSGLTVSATQISIASANNGGRPVYGYQVASSSVSGAVGSISPATLTYVADSSARRYGDSNPAFSGSITGFVAGETEATATTGVATFTSGADGTSSLGNYAITGSGLTANNGNYAFVQAAENALSLTITPRPLVIAADAHTRIYGEDNPQTGTATGDDLVNGDFITMVSLTSSATPSSDVGSYGLTASGASGGGLSNYAISYATRPDGLTVTPRPVTIQADLQSRLYGDQNPVLSFTTTSLGAGTAVTGLLTTSATAKSDIGAYTIERGSLTDSANPNYLLTFIGADLSVTPRPLVVTADAVSRVYGDENPLLTYTTTSTGMGSPLIGSLTTAANATSDVGFFPIGRGRLTDAANPNYALTFIGADLSVVARPVTITANAQSRRYGDANPALTYSTSSLGSGTPLIGSLASNAGVAAGIGTYGIDRGDLTDAANINYALTYIGANLTVTPRPLIVTADQVTRLYGDLTPFIGTATGDDLIVGDTITSVLLASAATGASDIGSYDLLASAAVGNGLGNYAITYLANNTGLIVTQRPVTVTANSQSRVYGDNNPVLSYKTTSLGIGAALKGELITGATATSDVGQYVISRGSITDAANPNYAINVNVADLIITARPVTVVADHLTKRYGDENPALTFKTTSLGSGVVLAGSLTTSATATSDTGSYAIDRGSLTDEFNPNYRLSYQGNFLSINPREPLTPQFLASSVLRDRSNFGGSDSNDAAIDKMFARVEVEPRDQLLKPCIDASLCITDFPELYRLNSRKAKLSPAHDRRR